MSSHKPYIIEFKEQFSLEKGFLAVAEGNQLPFSVKRLYWTYNFPENDIKGNHANLETEFVILCLSGRAFIKTITEYNEHADFLLDKPNTGLFLPKKYWREIKATSDSVILVLASHEYFEEDCVRDFDAFIVK